MACIVCGAPIEAKAKGAPPRYCRPGPGRTKSRCRELAQLLQRVVVLVEWLRENRSPNFGPEFRNGWRTFHYLANVTRPPQTKNLGRWARKGRVVAAQSVGSGSQRPEG